MGTTTDYTHAHTHKHAHTRARTGALWLGGLILLPALGACSTTSDPSASPAPPTAAPPTPATPAPTTPTPTTPTPPVMPEAAKAHTPAGARAFVRHFWKVVDYASAQLDPAQIERLTADGCGGCRGPLVLIERLRAGRGELRGAQSDLSKLRALDFVFGGEPRTEVTFDVKTPVQTLDFPGQDRDQQFPAGVRRTRFLLKPVSVDGWRVVMWEPL